MEYCQYYSGEWPAEVTLNIWHLKDEKWVLLHNEFSPSLLFSSRRLSLSIWPYLLLLKSVDGNVANISWPSPPWDCYETHSSGWDGTSKGKWWPVMRFAFWVCFRDFLLVWCNPWWECTNLEKSDKWTFQILIQMCWSVIIHIIRWKSFPLPQIHCRFH